MLDNEQYWKPMKNISSFIDILEVKNDTYKTNILKDTSFTAKVIQPFAFPSNNLTINSCFTVNLHKFQNVKSILISYQRDINIYFHYPGQFFYTWRNELNKISSSTKQVIDAKESFLKWYDLNVNMAIESYQGLYKVNTANYDSCVADLLVTANESIGDFILPSNSGNVYGNTNIDENAIILLNDKLQTVDMSCSDPTDIVRIQTIENAMAESRMIPLNYGLKPSNYTYTDKITMKNLNSMPKIMLNFPKFSKKLQVSKYLRLLHLVLMKLFIALSIHIYFI